PGASLMTSEDQVLLRVDPTGLFFPRGLPMSIGSFFPGRGKPSSLPRPGIRTWFFWTSDCQGWTATKWRVSFGDCQEYVRSSSSPSRGSEAQPSCNVVGKRVSIITSPSPPTLMNSKDYWDYSRERRLLPPVHEEA